MGTLARRFIQEGANVGKLKRWKSAPPGFSTQHREHFAHFGMTLIDD